MESKKNNSFVRILIVLLCIGIGMLVGYKFFGTAPKGQISSGLIILITFLVVLVLAESFDNFSIGQLISLSRKINEKEKINNRLERKNSELINQIVSITNSQSQHQNQNQSQSHTNVYGDLYMSRGNQPKEMEPSQLKELLEAIEDTPLLREQIESIQNYLSEKNLLDDVRINQVLIKYLAATQINLEFETVHSVIFGSQLILLKELNTNYTEGLNISEVERYVSDVFKRYSSAFSNWDFEGYMSFLYSHLLITKIDHERVQITIRGREYLTWIVKNGKREDNHL